MLIDDICLNFPRETQRAHLMYIFELHHRGKSLFRRLESLKRLTYVQDLTFMFRLRAC